MKFVNSPLAGAYLVELKPFADPRGLFIRTFCQKEFAKIGFHKPIVQINHSLTLQKGTVRGMHYQRPPAAEIKIVRCIQGKVFDVIVDLRMKSPTYKQWYGIELSRDNMRMLFMPEGFAHGFQTLSDNAELIYHHSAFYSPEHENALRFDDPAIGIQWPLAVTEVSVRDRKHPYLDDSFEGLD